MVIQKTPLVLANKREEIILKIKRLEYSLKNNKTKPEEEYSILYPLTNSLSPSGRSRGARISSHITVGTQNNKIIAQLKNL
jgi:hypothetical protein